jgi:hypothetical protein
MSTTIPSIAAPLTTPGITPMDLANLFCQIAMAAAAVYAVTIARKGLKTWREQLDGALYLEIARKVATAAYAFFNKIDDWRLLLNSKNKEDLRAEYRVARVELERSLLEAEILWGMRVKRARLELAGCASFLFGTAEKYFKIEADYPAPHVRPPHILEEQIKLTNIIYGDDEGDPLTSRLDKVIADFHLIFDPHLPKQYRDDLLAAAETRKNDISDRRSSEPEIIGDDPK